MTTGTPEPTAGERATGAALTREPVSRPAHASPRSSRRPGAGPVAVVALLVLLDQVIKQVVERALDLGVPVPVWGPLHWLHARNTGIAFSWLGNVGPWALVALSGAVLLLMLVLYARTPRAHRLARAGFVLVVAGAIGNLIDRALLGYVTDYVFLHWRGWSFAVFNLADALITVGAALVLLDEVLGWGRPGRPAGRAGRHRGNQA